ncbi:MAG: hypothetical protein H0T89_04000 [Deltaproteobacteria bacterium]|nr:hypothetical protein [Deltaproteobacteria bacterium]MDQ3300906.1 hypothetical protein [Myxococcota bacterium]
MKAIRYDGPARPSNEGEPIARHRRYFRWGIPSVLLIQLFPLLFIYVAQEDSVELIGILWVQDED